MTSSGAAPFLTIVIPTYNRSAMLRRCLDSVLMSDFQDMEVLVSDNASPDNTPEILKTFSDPRLRHWRNPKNVGAEPNILGLWRQARGEWIFCLTDDDYLRPGAIEKVVAIMRAHPDCGAILSDLQVVNEQGAETSVYSFHDREGLLSAGLEALKNMVWAAHVFSRITLRRKWMDLAGVERHLKSMYPQMFAIGSCIREHPGYYIKDRLVAHTSGNKNFWDYQPDMMIGGRIDLVKDLLPGRQWSKPRRVLIKQLIKGIARYHHVPAWKSAQWVERQREFLKIPEVRFSPTYWKGVLKFLLSAKR